MFRFLPIVSLDQWRSQKECDMNTNEILGKIQGLHFRVVGPFLVADMDGRQSLEVGENGMEEVWPGTQTEPHTHAVTSFYQTEGLDMVDEAGCRYTLHRSALIIVLPGVGHSWIPKDGQSGAVGSVGHRHEKQRILRAA